jgi:hypothetical protein
MATHSMDVLRSQVTELRDQAGEEAARLAGRGASWVDETSHALADRVAAAVSGWGRALGDRIVRWGEDVAGRD